MKTYKQQSGSDQDGGQLNKTHRNKISPSYEQTQDRNKNKTKQKTKKNKRETTTTEQKGIRIVRREQRSEMRLPIKGVRLNVIDIYIHIICRTRHNHDPTTPDNQQ